MQISFLYSLYHEMLCYYAVVYNRKEAPVESGYEFLWPLNFSDNQWKN